MSSLKNGRFDVVQQADRLVLTKRPESVWRVLTIPLLGCILFMTISWEGFPPKDISKFLFFLAPPLICAPYFLEALRIAKGEVFVFDLALNRIERDAVPISALSQMAQVRVESKDSDDSANYSLTIVLQDGKAIVLARYGTTEEFSPIAKLIAELTQSPLQIDK